MILSILTSWSSAEDKIRASLLLLILLLASQAIISNYLWLVDVAGNRSLSPYLESFGYVFSWMVALISFALIIKHLFNKFMSNVVGDEYEEEELQKDPELKQYLDVSGYRVPEGPLSDQEKYELMRETMGISLHNGHEFWTVAEKNGRRTHDGKKDGKWATHCLTQKQKYKPL